MAEIPDSIPHVQRRVILHDHTVSVIIPATQLRKYQVPFGLIPYRFVHPGQVEIADKCRGEGIELVMRNRFPVRMRDNSHSHEIGLKLPEIDLFSGKLQDVLRRSGITFDHRTTGVPEYPGQLDSPEGEILHALDQRGIDPYSSLTKNPLALPHDTVFPAFAGVMNAAPACRQAQR